MLFQPPPRTQYDLNFEVFGIPVQVHPFFWVIVILLGGAAGDLMALLIWVLVVFFSILIHELGHSLMMRRYGQSSYIALYGGGGLAIPDGLGWGGYSYDSLDSRERINISLAGPMAGFLLAGLVLLLSASSGAFIGWQLLLGFIPLPVILLPWGGQLMFTLVSMVMWVNIFWGLINLLPIFPLDGGRVSREIFLNVDPIDGAYKSLQLSVFSAALVAVIGLLYFQSPYMTLFFGFLAFQSYQSMQGGYGRF